MSRFPAILLLTLCLTGSSARADDEPKGTGVITNLEIDAAHILRQLPGVVAVEVPLSPDKATRRIVYLKDWHFVSKESFVAELRDQSGDPITTDVGDRRYAEHLDDVEAVQQEQMGMLRHLIQHHGLKQVYIEGLTPQDKPIFETQVKLLRTLRNDLAELRAQRDDLAQVANDDASKKLLAKIDAALFENRCDLLRLGAAGRLNMSQDLEAVLPVEEEKTYRAARPVQRDGRVVLKQELIEAREDAQVKTMLAGGPFALIILGGSHDLADNVKRLADGKCELIVVETIESLKRSGPERR